MPHTTRPLLVMLILPLLLGAACSKSPKAPPATQTTGRAGPEPATPAPAHPPHLLTVPAQMFASSGPLRFVVFGDSRARRCLCDAKLKPGKHCGVRYRSDAPKKISDCALVDQGPDLVMGAVAARLLLHRAKPGSAHLILFTGDLVYRGSCTRDWDWARRVFLSKVDTRRVFPILGNHDTWHKRGEPPAVPQYFRAFPHLKVSRGGGSQRPHYYAFRVGEALFVNLCSGGYPSGGTAADFAQADREWLCEAASFDIQMRWMERVLAHGASLGVRHVIVQYHKPSYSCSRHPPLGPKHDPLAKLRPFKKRHPKVNVVAFSGHNHATEVYRTGGVLVVVAGGGGAPQHLQSGPKACHPDKPDQPPERFWKGRLRTSRYNYFLVTLSGSELSLQEHCLTRSRGRLTFQKGSHISASGQITHTPGACDLAPESKTSNSNIKSDNKSR